MTGKNTRGSVDQRILGELQKRGRVSLKEIARKLHIPVSTVHEKVKRLEREGLIKSYHALLNSEALGFGVTSFILVSVDYSSSQKPDQQKLAKKISSLKNVQEVQIISGDWDILVKIKARSVRSAGDFVTKHLRKISGVGKTKTMVVFETVKESTAIDL